MLKRRTFIKRVVEYLAGLGSFGGLISFVGGTRSAEGAIDQGRDPSRLELPKVENLEPSDIATQERLGFLMASYIHCLLNAAALEIYHSTQMWSEGYDDGKTDYVWVGSEALRIMEEYVPELIGKAEDNRGNITLNIQPGLCWHAPLWISDGRRHLSCLYNVVLVHDNKRRDLEESMACWGGENCDVTVCCVTLPEMRDGRLYHYPCDCSAETTGQTVVDVENDELWTYKGRGRGWRRVGA